MAPHLHRLDRRRHRTVAGHDDHGQMRVDRQRLAHHGDAVHFRHHEIGHDDVEFARTQGLDRLLSPRREAGHMVPFARAASLHRARMSGRLVIDDQEPSLGEISGMAADKKRGEEGGTRVG